MICLCMLFHLLSCLFLTSIANVLFSPLSSNEYRILFTHFEPFILLAFGNCLIIAYIHQNAIKILSNYGLNNKLLPDFHSPNLHKFPNQQ
jgi:hypothetical protein